MQNDFFRDEARRRRSDSLYGSVLVKGAINWPHIFVLTAACFVFVVVIIGIATYPISAQASGELKSSAGATWIKALRAGTAEEIFVNEGQRVTVGQALIGVSSSETPLTGQDVGGIADRSFDARSDQLQNQINAINDTYRNSRAAKLAEISFLKDAIASIDNRLRATAEMAAHSKEDYELALTIAKRGFISKRDIRQREEDVYTKEVQHSELVDERRSKAAQIVKLQSEIEASRGQQEADLSSLRASLAEISLSKVTSELTRGHLLRAPQAGVIGDIAVEVGDAITPGDSVLTISPSGGHVYAEIDLDDRSAPTVKSGQKFSAEIATFPAARYGALSGYIEHLSYAPRNDQSQNEAPRYRALGRIKLPGPNERLAKVRLVAGMRLKVQISLTDTSIFDRLSNPRFWFSGT